MVLGEEGERPGCVDDVCAEKGRVEGELGWEGGGAEDDGGEFGGGEDGLRMLE